jgi:hypothetical protein
MASVIPSCREYNDILSIVVITLGQCFLMFISRFWEVCTVIVIVLVDCVLYVYIGRGRIFCIFFIFFRHFSYISVVTDASVLNMSFLFVPRLFSTP